MMSSNTRLDVEPFIESIVRKVALISAEPCSEGYAGWTARKFAEANKRLPQQKITGLPGQPARRIMSGFLLLVCQTFHTVAVRKVAVSRQRFQRRVDILQNRRLALLAPVQGDHLLVRFDLENIPRQFFEII